MLSATTLNRMLDYINLGMFQPMTLGPQHQPFFMKKAMKKIGLNCNSHMQTRIKQKHLTIMQHLENRRKMLQDWAGTLLIAGKIKPLPTPKQMITVFQG